jgi:chitin disaccharide deacetylase
MLRWGESGRPTPELEMQITADDYGLHEAVNRGIEALAFARQVDAVSVMGHRDADWSSLDELKRSGVPLGAHLVLVQERPLIQSGALATLLEDGCLPGSYRALFRRVALRPALARALAEEAAAQVARLRAEGVTIAFVNSHEHVHLFPPIWSALHGLLDSDGWQVRAVPRPRWSAPPKQLAVDVSGALCWWRAPLRRARAIRPVGIDLAGRMTAQAVERVARRHAGELAGLELVVHPGRDSRTLQERYGHWKYRWGEELAALQSGAVRRALESRRQP